MMYIKKLGKGKGKGKDKGLKLRANGGGRGALQHDIMRRTRGNCQCTTRTVQDLAAHVPHYHINSYHARTPMSVCS
jgi:hypothetical protein